MSTVLERHPVEYDGSVILEKAQELGHEELLRKAEGIAYDTRNRLSMIHQPLGDPLPEHIEGAMVSLGLEPYTEYSVAQYKAKMDRKLIWGNLPAIIAENVGPLTLGGSILSAPVWILTAAIMMICGVQSYWLGVSGLVMLGMFGVGWAVMTIIDKKLVTKKACRWSFQNFEYYNLKKVPDFALQTAVDLSERCPGIRFRIEECHIEDQMVDPFLVAVSGGQSWYLEVWNEPGFEK